MPRERPIQLDPVPDDPADYLDPEAAFDRIRSLAPEQWDTVDPEAYVRRDRSCVPELPPARTYNFDRFGWWLRCVGNTLIVIGVVGLITNGLLRLWTKL
jgi:hypothetical protein